MIYVKQLYLLFSLGKFCFIFLLYVVSGIVYPRRDNIQLNLILQVLRDKKWNQQPMGTVPESLRGNPVCLSQGMQVNHISQFVQCGGC